MQGGPRPRGSTRHYVGLSDSSETDRILIRANTNRGDTWVWTVEAASEISCERAAGDRARQLRAVVETLASGDIAAEEADTLLVVLERESCKPSRSSDSKQTRESSPARWEG